MLSFLKRLFQSASRDPQTSLRKPLSPQAEAWLYERLGDQPLSPAARAFIDGKKSSLSAADVDPDNSAAVNRYSEACALKQQGDLVGAARLLAAACEIPNIYKGHYRLLFQLWRQFNRTDIKEHRYEPVIDRVS